MWHVTYDMWHMTHDMLGGGGRGENSLKISAPQLLLFVIYDIRVLSVIKESLQKKN